MVSYALKPPETASETASETAREARPLKQPLKPGLKPSMKPGLKPPLKPGAVARPTWLHRMEVSDFPYHAYECWRELSPQMRE